jgi:hypothetical protein
MLFAWLLCRFERANGERSTRLSSRSIGSNGLVRSIQVCTARSSLSRPIYTHTSPVHRTFEGTSFSETRRSMDVFVGRLEFHVVRSICRECRQRILVHILILQITRRLDSQKCNGLLWNFFRFGIFFCPIRSLVISVFASLVCISVFEIVDICLNVPSQVARARVCVCV